MRDGANLAVDGLRLRPDVQHLDDDRGVPEPAGDLRARPGLVHHAAVQRARDLRLPRRHRAGRVRERRARRGAARSRDGSTPDRVTFKYGLGDEFIEVLQVLHKTGLDSTEPVRVGGVEVSPRDVVAAALPDPGRRLGDRMTGKTCAGTWVTGLGPDGQPARGVPVPRGRQRADDGRLRLPGRRVADRDRPGGRARAARPRAPGAARACSAPRPSRPSPSSTCWPTTARPTASRTAPPPDPTTKPGICARRSTGFRARFGSDRPDLAWPP